MSDWGSAEEGEEWNDFVEEDFEPCCSPPKKRQKKKSELLETITRYESDMQVVRALEHQEKVSPWLEITCINS